MNIDYTIKTKKSFNEAVAAVEKETVSAGFKVLYIHDVQATLGAKGFKIEPLKIIEICNAKSANEVLGKDIRLGLMLPCKINVYETAGQIYISALLPTFISEVFPEINLGNLPQEIEQTIKKIAEAARK